MKMQVESISPEQAVQYLKTNTANYRKLSWSIVKRYADDMSKDRWELNGEPICFGKDGTLKDGQHRLAAIIMSKKTVKMAVVRDVENDVTIYNIGAKRTASQTAQAQGVECNSTVAAAAKIIANRFKSRVGTSGVVDYINANADELNRAYRITCYGPSQASKNAPCVAACYLMLRTELVRSYEAELFFRLFNDKGLTRCDGYDPSPALIARKMFDDRGKCRSGYQIQKERLEIIVLALRDFAQGKERKTPYKISEPFFFTDLMDQIEEV